MTKKCYRFYGGFMASQENWLNKMAARGYRLVRTAKAAYEFECCSPGQYQYRVEFIGQQSMQSAEAYARFLEDFGYRVFFKSINLSCSVGKAQGRPWAEKGGRIAAGATTYGRELLIIEKPNDGAPFELHTTFEDKQNYCRTMRKPWLFLLLVSAAAGIVTREIAWGAIAAVSLIVCALFQAELGRLKKQAAIQEQ